MEFEEDESLKKKPLIDYHKRNLLNNLLKNERLVNKAVHG